MRQRAFCIMSLRVVVVGEVKGLRPGSRSGSESEQGVQSAAADAKPSDLPFVEKCSDELRVGVKG